ncbi:MAG: hypothetical protein A2W03_02350 [Candidatus Aminicenantes bacterium RBG_16_63_16]|nr:MAG: hypothetical protein A2W03_02350 [Candidatus Aminicenantes bacterium RBG_16_63_16]
MKIHSRGVLRRAFLKSSLSAVMALANDALGARRPAFAKAEDTGGTIDVARAAYRDLWLHHPCIGDASFDSFTRLAGNPIYRGAPPFEWPVNGFLFEDPPAKFWYAYIGMYPRGYWPAGGCRLLRSRDRGGSWDDLGIVLSGSPTTFDGDGKKPGGMPDISVCFDDGAYHMIYDWANPDNSDGGLAYARSNRPEGPFARAPEPIHAESRQPLILGKYKRVYAPTLFRRKNDWLILADMSTPRNAGGTWALVAMTAAKPSGPYSPPELLLYPQSGAFHPAPIEWYPSFTYQGDVYAPATSVGANRSFQAIFRAPLERAHIPTAWTVERCGSCWHDEPVEREARGLWGQTFSGFVDSTGSLKALFPSKDGADRGTINLAERNWNRPDRDGFTLSAPNGPALSLLLREHRDFELKAEIRATGAWRLVWNHRAPLGTNRIWHADGGPHSLVFSDCTELAIADVGWELRQSNVAGEASVLGRGTLPPREKHSQSVRQGHPPDHDQLAREIVRIRQRGGRLSISIGGGEVFSSKAPAGAGSIGFVAESPGILYVDRFLLSNLGESCSKFLLATDAILGAGSGQDGWEEEKSAHFKFGQGYACATAGIAAKWNYRGRGFRLWSPRGPAFGRARILVDGREQGEIILTCPRDGPSRPVFEVADLPLGFHAVTLTQTAGRLACDALEVFI